jgi:hypothetical protein
MDLYLASGLLLGVWLFVLGRDLPLTLIGSVLFAATVALISTTLSLALRRRVLRTATVRAPVEPQDEAV